MSRYLGPKLKITRRLGNLPGLTKKHSKKDSRPGQHGRKYKEEKEKSFDFSKLKFLKTMSVVLVTIVLS